MIELQNVSRSFPGARALTDVSVTFRPGRVHALVGENGAGKSTLIKIASGVLQPDAGEVRVDGRVVRLTPREARDLRIRVLHQERQVALTRTVADNVVLGEAPRNRFGLSSQRLVEREAQRRLARVGVDLDVRAPVAMLPIAQRQLLELARAITLDARCLIMDEPTASLHPDEIEQLFGVVRRVREHGVGVVYISHHLSEVMALADDYTVLRDGRSVGGGLVADTSPSGLVEKMFGTDVSLRREEIHGGGPGPGEVAARLRGVRYGRRLNGVDLDVRYGETVVVNGPVGSGAAELGRIISGALRPTAGTVEVLGGPGRSRRHAAKRGVALIPADRKREGLLLDRPVHENSELADDAARPMRWYSAARAAQRCRRGGRALDLKASDVRAPIRGLSGGNQQKVLIDRWLRVGSRVLVLDEPTVGVDIPSKAEIYRRLRALTRAGAAVVVLSTEYQEIRCVADRVVVMRDGVVAGEVPGPDATEQALFALGSRS
jgi:ABC-type sugar transport system ATPase subunit